MKPASVEEAAERARRLVAQQHVLLHLRAAQVEDTVRQPDVLGQIVVVETERRRDRGVEHVDRVAEDFHFAARHVGVGRSGRAGADESGNFQAELVAHGFGDREHFGAIGVADDLGQPFTIAQVDENDPAVVAPAMCPATQGDFLADRLGIELSAIMGSHGNEKGS